MKQFRMFISTLSLSMCSFAYAAGEINLQLLAQKQVIEVDKNGIAQAKLVDLETAIPGDTIVYTTNYSNISNEIADAGAVITNNISPNLLYLANSARCDDCVIEFSVDGKQFALPEQLTVLDEAGQPRLATPKDYTRVRWILNNPIAPAASGRVSYKAKIRTLSQ